MKLFVIQGIIISTTKPYIKASKLKIKCKSCENVKIINLGPGQNPYIPSFCTGGNNNNTKCTNDPFVAMPDS
jgi:DNA replicative helicase MCM subunit Mcm2 (Cdc46/Mcm family)